MIMTLAKMVMIAEILVMGGTGVYRTSGVRWGWG